MEKQSRRERNKLQCRRRILRASRQLFSAKGYEETTMEDVAERADVSKATLYNYFPGKDSLLTGIAEAELEDINSLIAWELREEQSPVEKLRRALQTLVLDSMRYIPLCRKITYLNSCEDSGLFATRVEMLRIFHSLVREAQDKGEFRRDIDTGDIVDLVMGVYLCSQFQWQGISGYSEGACVEKLDRFFDMALAGVLTAPGEAGRGPEG